MIGKDQNRQFRDDPYKRTLKPMDIVDTKFFVEALSVAMDFQRHSLCPVSIVAAGDRLLLAGIPPPDFLLGSSYDAVLELRASAYFGGIMPLTESLHFKFSADAGESQDDDQCYYTVGVHSVMPMTRGNFRAIWQNRLSSQPEKVANLDPSFLGGEKSDASSDATTPSRLNSNFGDKPWQAQYDFCKYGIDKPILNNGKTSPPNSRAKNRKGCLKVFPGDRVDDKACYHPWVIHPSNPRRQKWDLFIILLVVIVLVEAPLNAAFFPDVLDPIELLILNVILDIIFAVDILLNFWTGYIEEHTAVATLKMKPQEIRRNYIRGWFAVDLLSTVPFDYSIIIILQTATHLDVHPNDAVAQAVKVLAMLRILRLCRLYRYLPRCQKIFYAQEYMYARVLSLALLMVIVSHWNGCMQFLVNHCLGFPPKSWISISKLQNAPWFEQWSWSLFNAVSQTFGIGFGRSTPETLVDMWFTLWGMVTGTSGYALILANIATMWQHVDASRKLHRQKMQEIEDYMTFRRFPAKLRVRVRDYFDQRYQGHVFNESKILNTLSDPLKEVVMRHNCEETVRSVPFFAKADPHFVNELVTRLRFNFFQPDDLITKFGTLGSNMFFIQSGKVTVANEYGKILTTLGGGMYFGELSILVPCKRNATVRAKTHCSLLELRSEDFHQVLKKFPFIQEAIRALAAEIVSNAKQSPSPQTNEQDTVTTLGSFIQF
ncbi:potassium/sodium hyperpolarization-activated cyclic nucleotide-gated channel 2 [Galendromus occidentalis]|uniref:Potassium/sodium hyperpolarization-activated cyclic nucleotide-gated channel 2 n=1 Tax=Galendromus occidentalis TaxID=34638 RepID=A0AAJ6QUI9_9ACAR|nr:potassium/sodium hyperpolarization-activated cyclic nucleotide-gated channel 2 [Galendromus occidentalis]